MTIFVIEDEAHAEWSGEFRALEDAIGELARRSKIAWDLEPNRAPCKSWKTCGLDYVVVEFDDQVNPWREIQRMDVLKIRADGVVWTEENPTSSFHLDPTQAT